MSPQRQSHAHVHRYATNIGGGGLLRMGVSREKFLETSCSFFVEGWGSSAGAGIVRASNQKQLFPFFPPLQNIQHHQVTYTFHQCQIQPFNSFPQQQCCPLLHGSSLECLYPIINFPNPSQQLLPLPRGSTSASPLSHSTHTPLFFCHTTPLFFLQAIQVLFTI